MDGHTGKSIVRVYHWKTNTLDETHPLPCKLRGVSGRASLCASAVTKNKKTVLVLFRICTLFFTERSMPPRTTRTSLGKRGPPPAPQTASKTRRMGTSAVDMFTEEQMAAISAIIREHMSQAAVAGLVSSNLPQVDTTQGAQLVMAAYPRASAAFSELPAPVPSDISPPPPPLQPVLGEQPVPISNIATAAPATITRAEVRPPAMDTPRVAAPGTAHGPHTAGAAPKPSVGGEGASRPPGGEDRPKTGMEWARQKLQSNPGLQTGINAALNQGLSSYGIPLTVDIFSKEAFETRSLVTQSLAIIADKAVEPKYQPLFIQLMQDPLTRLIQARLGAWGSKIMRASSVVQSENIAANLAASVLPAVVSATGTYVTVGVMYEVLGSSLNAPVGELMGVLRGVTDSTSATTRIGASRLFEFEQARNFYVRLAASEARGDVENVYANAVSGTSGNSLARAFANSIAAAQLSPDRKAGLLHVLSRMKPQFNVTVGEMASMMAPSTTKAKNITKLFQDAQPLGADARESIFSRVYIEGSQPQDRLQKLIKSGKLTDSGKLTLEGREVLDGIVNHKDIPISDELVQAGWNKHRDPTYFVARMAVENAITAQMLGEEPSSIDVFLSPPPAGFNSWVEFGLDNPNFGWDPTDKRSFAEIMMKGGTPSRIVGMASQFLGTMFSPVGYVLQVPEIILRQGLLFTDMAAQTAVGQFLGEANSLAAEEDVYIKESLMINFAGAFATNLAAGIVAARTGKFSAAAHAKTWGLTMRDLLVATGIEALYAAARSMVPEWSKEGMATAFAQGLVELAQGGLFYVTPMALLMASRSSASLMTATLLVMTGAMGGAAEARASRGPNSIELAADGTFMPLEDAPAVAAKDAALEVKPTSKVQQLQDAAVKVKKPSKVALLEDQQQIDVSATGEVVIDKSMPESAPMAPIEDVPLPTKKPSITLPVLNETLTAIAEETTEELVLKQNATALALNITSSVPNSTDTAPHEIVGPEPGREGESPGILSRISAAASKVVNWATGKTSAKVPLVEDEIKTKAPSKVEGLSTPDAQVTIANAPAVQAAREQQILNQTTAGSKTLNYRQMVGAGIASTSNLKQQSPFMATYDPVALGGQATPADEALITQRYQLDQYGNPIDVDPVIGKPNTAPVGWAGAYDKIVTQDKDGNYITETVPVNPEALRLANIDQVEAFNGGGINRVLPAASKDGLTQGEVLKISKAIPRPGLLPSTNESTPKDAPVVELLQQILAALQGGAAAGGLGGGARSAAPQQDPMVASALKSRSANPFTIESSWRAMDVPAPLFSDRSSYMRTPLGRGKPPMSIQKIWGAQQSSANSLYNSPDF